MTLNCLSVILSLMSSLTVTLDNLSVSLSLSLNTSESQVVQPNLVVQSAQIPAVNTQGVQFTSFSGPSVTILFGIIQLDLDIRNVQPLQVMHLKSPKSISRCLWGFYCFHNPSWVLPGWSFTSLFVTVWLSGNNQEPKMQWKHVWIANKWINNYVYLQTFNLYKSFLSTFTDVTLVSSQHNRTGWYF